MQWYCEPHIPFKQYSYLLDNSNFPGRLQWEVFRNLSQIAFPLLPSSMCWLPCSEFKNLYFFTTNEYSNVKQLSWTINYSSRCSRSSVDYVSSLVHTAALDREQALCVIEVNKCNYLYCLVAAKICTVCLELYRACRFFFRHCRRCFVAPIGDQIFTRVDSTRAYYVMWSPSPARGCIRKVSTLFCKN